MNLLLGVCLKQMKSLLLMKDTVLLLSSFVQGKRYLRMLDVRWPSLDAKFSKIMWGFACETVPGE